MRTRVAPNLSAIAPATGPPTPHSRFWMAIASANTSRPQPFACDSGVRKNPIEERGPKVMTEMQQPHSISTTGVRQVNALVIADDVVRMEFSSGEACIHRASHPCAQTILAQGPH